MIRLSSAVCAQGNFSSEVEPEPPVPVPELGHPEAQVCDGGGGGQSDEPGGRAL
jgi:hypothetical protein